MFGVTVSAKVCVCWVSSLTIFCAGYHSVIIEDSKLELAAKIVRVNGVLISS